MVEAEQASPSASCGRRYGAGLPFVGRRRLSEHERQRTHRRLRRLEFGAIAWLCSLFVVALVASLCAPDIEQRLDLHVGGTPGVVLAATGSIGLITALLFGPMLPRLIGVLAMATLPGLQGLQQFGVAIPTAITWCVLLVFVVLGNARLCMLAWQHARVLRHRRHILEDLDYAWVEQFAGPSDAMVDDSLNQLGRVGALRGLRRLELLPRSGVVLRIDGRPVSRLVTVHLAEIAPLHLHAFRARLPDGVVAEGQGPSIEIDLRRRSLTPAERAEIARHIRRLRRGIWPVVAVTIAIALITGIQLCKGLQADALTRGISLAWYALAAVAWGSYARRVIAARKLEHDRDLRWVVTVHDPENVKAETLPPKLEVLPISQLAWTENAAPALWRVSRI